uniref:Uncharacterized protein n=1 Tax=Tanacetum cinerariifolium TaxID=118510 RepID=A0A699VXJ6_TANCI|nr:hypothetical protein [Tanacetum cinerariifolium]
MDIKWNMALLSMRADKFWKSLINQKLNASTIIRWVILQENAKLPKTRTEEGETPTDSGLKLKNRLQKH